MYKRQEFNRWIRATNAVSRDIKKKITLLFDWIAEAKAELAKPQAPDLVSLDVYKRQAVAQRLGITATTLDGILTVKGQRRR